MLRPLVTAALLALPALTQAQDAPIDDALVAEVGAEAAREVGQALGVDLAELRFRTAGPAELAGFLVEELGPLFHLIVPDPFVAQAQCEATAAMTAQILLAKYVWGGDGVLVMPDAIARNAKAFDAPELLSRDALFAVLAHEAVHAAQEERHGMSELRRRAATLEAMLVLGAVSEGHAQFVARRVCASRGTSGAFERLSGIVGKLDDDAIDPAERFGAESTRFAYADGERFIAGLFEAGGAEAVARAFEAPPTEFELLYHPEWFLDPAQRPPFRLDLDAGLAVAETNFPAAHWAREAGTVQPAELHATMGALSREEVDGHLHALRRGKSLRLARNYDASGGMVAIMAFEFASEEAAAAFARDLERVIDTRPDEARAAGFEIRASEEKRFEGSGITGRWTRRLVGPPGTEQVERADVCILRRGALVLELDTVQLDQGYDWSVGWATAIANGVGTANAEGESDG